MEIPEELEKRLQNWGRWGRAPRTQGRSWLAKYASAPEENRAPVSTVNIRDALEVDAAWRAMPFDRNDDRRAKLLVAALYTSGRPIESDLRNLRKYHKVLISPREVQPLKEKAVRYIGRRLGYVLQ